MFILEVVPISRGIRTNTLSYYSRHQPAIGSLVSVPVRKKRVPALVSSVYNVHELKSEVRKSNYQLRRVEALNERKVLHPSIAELAEITASHFASPLPIVMRALIPQIPLEELADAPKLKKGAATPQTLYMQTTTEERFRQFRSLAREARSHKRALMIVFPDRESLQLFFDSEILETDRQNAVIFHSGISKKKLIDTWNKTLEAEAPLILTTPLYSLIPLKNLETIIVEQESSAAYKTQRRPYLDWRFVIEKFCHLNNMRCIFSDCVLSPARWREVENLKRIKRFAIERQYNIHPRVQIITRSTSGERQDEKIIFSNQALHLLDQTLAIGKKTLCYVTRKGLYPVLICQDCGHHQYTIDYQKQIERYQQNKDHDLEVDFAVHEIDRCESCGSWRLSPITISLGRVAETLQGRYREGIYVADSVTMTATEAKKVVKQFEAAESGILATTKLGTILLSREVDNTVIVSIDTLLTLPDLNIEHEIMRFLTRISEKTNEQLMIQTRLQSVNILNEFASGNIGAFQRRQLKEREMLELPPYILLIKMTISHNVDEWEKVVAYLRNKLSNWRPQIYPALNRTNPSTNILLHIHPRDWPDKRLIAFLSQLPPALPIEVEPLSLL